MKFAIAVTILALVELSTQTDYCNKALCGTKPHVACNGPSSMSASCGAKGAQIALDASLKALIVDKHNQYRSKIATGKQEYASGKLYPQAARMSTMQWDDELALVAGFNARSCNFAHDKCRNTDTFNAAGQNLAIKSYYGQTFTEAELVGGMIDAWYKEASDANPSVIASYPEGWTGPMIGHFTQMVADRANKVGCAFVGWEAAPWIKKYLVCNYALTNIIDQPIYKAGNAGSGCTKGTNSKYPGLCSESEPVDSRL